MHVSFPASVRALAICSLIFLLLLTGAAVSGCASELSLEKSVGGASWKRSEKGDFAKVEILYATDRAKRDVSTPELYFGGDRKPASATLSLGTVIVAIPRDHRMASLESPAWWRLELTGDPGKHVTVVELKELGNDHFQSTLQRLANQSDDGHLLIFIHGFNVSFDEAARRLGQITYDLGFAGAPLLFSWASKGGISNYVADSNSIETATDDYSNILKQVSSDFSVKRITIVAHSMGNRLLMALLQDISKFENSTRSKFKEIIFAAPDIDSQIFCQRVPAALKTMNATGTLYASSNDLAIQISEKVSSFPRAGATTDGVLTSPNIISIDASATNTSLIGHSYYADSVSVISDLMESIKGVTPRLRTGLSPSTVRHRDACSEGGESWILKDRLAR